MKCTRPYLKPTILIVHNYRPLVHYEPPAFAATDSSSCCEGEQSVSPIEPSLDEFQSGSKHSQPPSEESKGPADAPQGSDTRDGLTGKSEDQVRECKNYSFELRNQVVEAVRREAKRTGAEPGRVIELKSEELGIPFRSIYRWFKGQASTKRRASHPVMEARLAQFIRSSSRRLKTREIAEKAREILERTEEGSAVEFNFSKGWFERFKRRMAGGEYDDIL